jgi:hypothetical protein
MSSAVRTGSPGCSRAQAARPAGRGWCAANLKHRGGVIDPGWQGRAAEWCTHFPGCPGGGERLGGRQGQAAPSAQLPAQPASGDPAWVCGGAPAGGICCVFFDSRHPRAALLGGPPPHTAHARTPLGARVARCGAARPPGGGGRRALVLQSILAYCSCVFRRRQPLCVCGRRVCASSAPIAEGASPPGGGTRLYHRNTAATSACLCRGRLQAQPCRDMAGAARRNGAPHLLGACAGGNAGGWGHAGRVAVCTLCVPGPDPPAGGAACSRAAAPCRAGEGLQETIVCACTLQQGTHKNSELLCLRCRRRAPASLLQKAGCSGGRAHPCPGAVLPALDAPAGSWRLAPPASEYCSARVAVLCAAAGACSHAAWLPSSAVGREHHEHLGICRTGRCSCACAPLGVPGSSS